MDRGIGSWVTRRAFLAGDSTAFITPAGRLTYRDVELRTNRLASGLRRSGVRRGDRVALLLANSVELVDLLVASAKLGAVVVPINTRLTATEVGYVLADAGVDVFVFHDHLATVGRGALSTPEVRVRSAVVVGGAPQAHERSFEDLLDAGDPAPFDGDVNGADIAVVMYTSGTTGRPKGAMLTHDNMLWNAVNVLGIEGGLTSRDITVTVAPMFHIGGLGVHTLPLLYVGGTNVVLPGFDPTETLRAMVEHRATVQFMVPAMWSALAQVPDFDSYDLSALRLALGGGSPCPLTMIEFLRQRGVPFVEAFGMTETAPLVTVLDSDHVTEKAGSIGRVGTHVEARIVDEVDRDVPVDTVGELVVRGANVFVGYWMNPSATAEAFRGGWFHTGDLGRMDAEGFITLVDRKKDMIISGGENVYPIEVEQVLLANPAVRDAAVVGAPDDRWGERVVAVVVHDPAVPAPTEAELIAWCRERLAHFKCPSEVHAVAELPRNATGKLVKGELRMWYSGVAGGVVQR